MTFNIYSVSEPDHEQAVEQLTDDDLVEVDLSSGELRQALLDRFRQEVKTEDVYFINFTLAHFELEFEEDLLVTEEGQQSILTDIENLIYDAEDEELTNMFWDFHNETIYVSGE